MALDEKARQEAVDQGRNLQRQGVTHTPGNYQNPVSPSQTPTPRSDDGGSQRGPHNNLAGGATRDSADAYNKGEGIQQKRGASPDPALDKTKTSPQMQALLKQASGDKNISQTAQYHRQNSTNRLESYRNIQTKAAARDNAKTTNRSSTGQGRTHQPQARKKEGRER